MGFDKTIGVVLICVASVLKTSAEVLQDSWYSLFKEIGVLGEKLEKANHFLSWGWDSVGKACLF